MKKFQAIGNGLSVLAVTWIMSGASASAQMPLMIGDILMPEFGNSDTTPVGTAVAVDGSGKWLKLRTAKDGIVRRNTGMADLLEFDAADTLATFDTGTKLSAEDYRFPTEAAAGLRVWVYDGDPLDRGVYKRELGGTNGSYGRSKMVRSRYGASARRSISPEGPGRIEERSGKARVVEIIIRAPGFVMNTVRSVYQNGNAPFLSVGLVALIIGFASFRDLAKGARRA